MFKKLKLLIGLVFLIVIVLVVLVVMNLDKIVKTGVEQGGTMVLHVPTTLDSVSIGLLSGSVGLDGLTVGNPDGFAAPEMFRMGHAHVDVDLLSLRGNEIVVSEIVVDGAEVTLELSGGKSNWGVVLDRLKGEPSVAEEPAEGDGGKTIRVDLIVLKNTRLKLHGMPLADSGGVPLPDLEIRDIGSGEGKGVTAHKLVAQIMGSLYEEMAKTVGNLPADQLGAQAGELKASLSESLQELGEGGTAPALPSGEVKEGLRGLFEGVRSSE